MISSVGAENSSSILFHSRRASTIIDTIIIDTIILTHHPNPFRDSLRSSQFPVWLDKPETKEKLKNKQVLMYCTGGVRCERASALLREKLKTDDKDLNVKGVYQLQGGIHKYLEVYDNDGGFWYGKNYTFDKRFAHSAKKLEEEGKVATIATCEACAKPWDRFRGKRRCPTCGVPSLVCKSCLDKDASGEKKLGRDVQCKLCIEEGITHKSQVKEKEERETREYEEKLRRQGGPSYAKKGEEEEAEVEAYDMGSIEPASNPTNETRLWIGNLNARTMTVDTLFEAIPNIKFVQWLTNPEGTCRGFCFVEMKTPEDAAFAMGMTGTKIEGRPLKANYQKADSKSSWPPPNAVWG